MKQKFGHPGAPEKKKKNICRVLLTLKHKTKWKKLPIVDCNQQMFAKTCQNYIFFLKR